MYGQTENRLSVKSRETTYAKYDSRDGVYTDTLAGRL